MEFNTKKVPEANMKPEKAPDFEISSSPEFSTEGFSLPLDAITEWDELDLLHGPSTPENSVPMFTTKDTEMDFSAWPMLESDINSIPCDFSAPDFLSVANPAFDAISFGESFQPKEPWEYNKKTTDDESKRVLQDLDFRLSRMESRLERVEKYTLNSDNRLMALNVGRKLDEVMEEVQSSKGDLKTLQTGLRNLIRVLVEEESAGR